MLGFEPPTFGFRACDFAHWARPHALTTPGGGRLDHPGAPGTGAPLCCGVRDPLGPHHHLPPLCVGVRDPLVPQHRSPPFVLVWSAPGASPGGLPPFCYGVGSLCPTAKLTFPLPLAALAASPYLPELLGTDLPRLPASGRPPAPRTGRCKARRRPAWSRRDTYTDVSRDFSRIIDLVSLT